MIDMDTKKLSKRSMPIVGLLSLFALFIGFTACNDLNLDATEGKGQINFYMADAKDVSKSIVTESSAEFGDSQESLNQPIENLEEVNLEVLHLRILFTESAADTTQIDTTESDSEAKWVDVEVTPFRINLLDLSEADTLISEAELNEGFYSEVRLILGDDNDVVVDGETHPLKVPSGQQSGYKVKFGGEPLHSGEIMDLTIEFDADKSVHVTGNGMYMLKPVLHAFKGRM